MLRFKLMLSTEEDYFRVMKAKYKKGLIRLI